MILQHNFEFLLEHELYRDENNVELNLDRVRRTTSEGVSEIQWRLTIDGSKCKDLAVKKPKDEVRYFNRYTKAKRLMEKLYHDRDLYRVE